MESTISIEQFREELQSWKKELASIKEEIGYFERHLENLTNKNLPKDLLAEVEHFQNLFICQKEVIDQLRHDLPDSRRKVESIFSDLRSGVLQGDWKSARDDEYSRHQNIPEDLEERMDTFRKIYIEIKQDFHRFDEDWM